MRLVAAVLSVSRPRVQLLVIPGLGAAALLPGQPPRRGARHLRSSSSCLPSPLQQAQSSHSCHQHHEPNQNGNEHSRPSFRVSSAFSTSRKSVGLGATQDSLARRIAAKLASRTGWWRPGRPVRWVGAEYKVHGTASLEYISPGHP